MNVSVQYCGLNQPIALHPWTSLQGCADQSMEPQPSPATIVREYRLGHAQATEIRRRIFEASAYLPLEDNSSLGMLSESGGGVPCCVKWSEKCIQKYHYVKCLTWFVPVKIQIHVNSPKMKAAKNESGCIVIITLSVECGVWSEAVKNTVKHTVYAVGIFAAINSARVVLP